MNWHDEFDYCDGALYWKYSLKNGARSAGCEAGSKDKIDGYVRVKVNSKSYRVHRIVLEMFNGPIGPDKEVDHINHDRSDNRIDNLRLVTKSENQKNKGIAKNNTSGVAGVTWCSKYGKWRARIMIDRKSIHLGRFDTIEQAAKARSDAVDALGFHKNHGDRN